MFGNGMTEWLLVLGPERHFVKMLRQSNVKTLVLRVVIGEVEKNRAKS